MSEPGQGSSPPSGEPPDTPTGGWPAPAGNGGAGNGGSRGYGQTRPNWPPPYGATPNGYGGGPQTPYGYGGGPQPPNGYGGGPQRGGGVRPPQGPRRSFAGNPRSLIWTIGILALVLILAGAHKITSDEIILFCVIVPSIILHEVSHGWVALAFGDDTAKRAGRLSLNPIRHIDPIGTIIVPALMALSGYGFFGWAKPVPVNVSKLRHPRNEGVVVSLAGPFTNVVLAGLAALAFRGLGAATAVSNGQVDLWARILFYFGLVNVALAAFNMIPIPPLDGSVLLERMLPRAWWPGYLRLRQYTMPLVILLVIINFYLNPGPITWLFEQIQNWWLHVVGLG